MENASTPGRSSAPIELALLAATAQQAAAEIGDPDEAGKAIDGALETLRGGMQGLMPSVFVLEHGRLWLVAQRGYAVVPDGIAVDRGVTGRAVRLGRAQLVSDVRSDPDYVPALPGISSELVVPLRFEHGTVGVLNIESERELPEGAARAIRPLAQALAPLAGALRASRALDLAALARLFVHLGSLRDPDEIASLAAASLPRVLPVATSQVVVWDEIGAASELASWRSDEHSAPLSGAELEAARAQVDPSVVCHVLDVGGRGRAGAQGSVVWFPLRANAEELGALVGISAASGHVDPVHVDTAAVLAAHAATSLDAAFALSRERHSAVTDSLTGVLNRRGLEERLERSLGTVQQTRVPLSLLVIDCDDFKEINDRAGHEFGDMLLREVADVLSRSLPDGAEAARLGGDEFVVMVPGAGVDAAEALGGQIRRVLAEELTDAGFPLRVSVGISTYPFDGAGPTGLLRTADQALYAAKTRGKDRIASFRDVAVSASAGMSSARTGLADGRRRGRSDSHGSVLADAIAATKAIEDETSAEEVCHRLCKSLVFVVGATACCTSRIQGDFIVDATEHALREVSLGDDVAYRIDDFPLTAEVLRTARPRAVSFLEGDVEPSEAFVLRELGMNALLMLPLRVAGRPWGLVELYEMRLRTFTSDDVAVAEFLTMQAERRLAALGEIAEPRLRPRRVYRLPDDGTPRVPRTR